MSTQTAPWFAFSAEGGTALRCVECDRTINLSPDLDHHPRVCPACGVETMQLVWKGRVVQIVLKKAPQVVVDMIRLAQEHFDELEYVELTVAVEELMDALYSANGVE
jgi:RNA polymerase subunit RPABC4/transcription elongation factor Spt4